MDVNRFVSVICEYNPFHHGHKYQLDELRRSFGGVVCIMSGDIVQRGTPAVAGKHTRAKAALMSGANLVLELPVPYCCASATDFAQAGVHIALEIGSAALAFGAEDSIEDLTKIHRYTHDANTIARAMVESEGSLSFPSALMRVVGETIGSEYAEMLKKPNNILALEYLGAISKYAYRDCIQTQPYVVRRSPAFLSSSAIRSFGSAESMLAELPDESRAVFSEAVGSDFPRDSSKLDAFFVGKLRQMAFSEALPDDIYSTPYDLARRILNSAGRCATVTEIVEDCKGKTFTSARIRRAICALVFGITSSMVHTPPCYTTVLAADEIGRRILNDIFARNSELQILTKPSQIQSTPVAEKLGFALSVSDIISLSAPKPISEIKKSPFIL